MHIHPNQINPNLQQDALYAAEKAAAKEQAERTRRKLMEFASEISGEVASEDCIVNLGEKDEGQEPEGRQKQKHAGGLCFGLGITVSPFRSVDRHGIFVLRKAGARLGLRVFAMSYEYGQS